jgi:hypothetical protein
MVSISTTDTKNGFSTVTSNIAGNGWGGSSIDVEALWRVAASCGTDVLPGTRDVKRLPELLPGTGGGCLGTKQHSPLLRQSFTKYIATCVVSRR